MLEEPKKDIRLHRLTLENFKCHRHLELDFRGRSATVYGDNGAGKTSLSDALTWLLFGRDSRGNADTLMDVKPLSADGAVRDHGAITSVEAVLTVEGRPLTLRRTLREVWTGKGGDKRFGGHSCEYFVDGAPARKQVFQERVAQAAPEEAFRLMTGLFRFPGELSWQERRAILFDMAQCPTDQELLGQREEYRELARGSGGKPLEEYRRQLLGRRRELTRRKDELPPRLDECRRLLDGTGHPDFSRAEEQRRVLLERQQALTEALEALARPEQWPRQSRLERLNAQLERLWGEEERSRREEERLNRERQALEEEAPPGSRCPACGQTLPRERLEKALAAYRRNREAGLARTAEALERLREGREQRQALGQQLRAQAADLESGEKPQAREALEGELARCRRELGEVGEILARERACRRALERQEQLREEAGRVLGQLARIGAQLDALDSFYRRKAAYVEGRVNALFRLAAFRLFREKVEGGLEERCDLVYRGVPWLGLNTGARVNLGLDILNALGRFYGFTAPVFIDNAEAVTTLEDTDAQVIRLVVSPGDRQLRLE